jgi:outer membrane autotransporter protein
VDQDTLIAQSLLLFEQYTITGTVQAVGGAHAAIPSALGDENERFAQRLLRDAIQVGTPAFDNGAPPTNQRSAAMGWFDGFGWTGSGNGDDRSGAGLEGGLGVNVSDQWRIGFGVSHGWINLDLDNAGGSANAELTEIGLYSRWRNDDFYVGLAGIAGFGSVDTDGLDTTASYDTTVFSVAGEAGYHVGFGGWDLTPNIGAQWTDIEMDGFTETGPFALTSSGSGNSFGKGWLGLRAQRQFDALTLSGHARLMAYADDDISVPVAFVGSSTELVIEGADRGTFGGEAGLAANLQLGDATSAFATYDARFRDSSVIHAGMVGLQVSW